MNFIRKKILKSEFTRNVLTLMTGTTIAQAIPILISPILTRIYTPEDFGLFSLYLSVSAMIAVVATGRYELAIMLPEKKQEALNVVALSLLITISLSLIVFIPIVFFNNTISKILNSPDISLWLYLLPLTVLFVGIYQCCSYWLNRQGKYNDISKFRILQASSIGSLQMIFKYVFTKGGLIAGNILGQGIATVFLAYRFLKNIKKENLMFSDISFLEMKRLGKKYKDFPMINSLHAFSDIARDSIAIILIANYFNSSILGFYALTVRLLKTPIAFIGSSIGQVFFKEASIFYQKGTLFKEVKKLSLVIISIAIPIFIVMFFLAEPFFKIVFGEEWEVSGTYTKILIPLFFINFINSPLSIIPLILDKQKWFFILNLLRGISFVGIFIICGYLKIDIYKTLICLSIIISIWGIVNLLWILYISKHVRYKINAGKEEVL